jgi:hypothetical protein
MTISTPTNSRVRRNTAKDLLSALRTYKLHQGRVKAKLEIFCLVIIFVFIKLFNRNESESTNINFRKMTFRTHYIRCLRIQFLGNKSSFPKILK